MADYIISYTGAEVEEGIGKALESVSTTTFNSEINSINNNIDTIEGDITTINSNIDTIEGDIDTIEGNIDTINGNISSIEGDIDTINGNISTINGDIDTIESELINQTSNINEIKTKVVSDYQDIKSNLDTLNGANLNAQNTFDITGYGITSLPKNTNGLFNSVLHGITIFNWANNGVDYANWTIGGTGTTKDANGIHLVQLSTSEYAYLDTNLKESSTYTIVLAISKIYGTAMPRITATGVIEGQSDVVIPQSVGIHKIKIITSSVINANKIEFKEISGSSGDYTDFEVYAILEGDWTTGDNANVEIGNLGYGTKSTFPGGGRIKSVGKNLLPNGNGEKNIEEWTLGYPELGSYVPYSFIFDGEHFVLTDTGVGFATQRIKVIPGLQITLKGIFGSAEGSVRVYDKHNNYVTAITTTGVGSIKSINITPVYDELVIAIRASIGTVKIKQLQIGIDVATYESYKTDQTYLSSLDGEPLRSVPAAKDEISTAGVLTRKIKNYVVQSGDISIVGTDTGEIVRYGMPAEPVNYKNNAIVDDNNVEIEGYTKVPYADRTNISSIGKYYISNTEFFVFVFATGTTLEQARTLLAGRVLNYQLATPTYEYLDIIKPQVYPSGTVYQEFALNGVSIYDSGINIPSTPIYELESITKIDFETGQEFKFDVSDATVAVDGLSFTHPDLSDGDIVYYTYLYDPSTSTLGDLTLSCYDSRYVILDSVNSKYYRWDITVANGVPTISVTEV